MTREVHFNLGVVVDEYGFGSKRARARERKAEKERSGVEGSKYRVC